MSKPSFYETVAANLIEQLQNGTAPWLKPWRPGNASLDFPINPVTGRRYRGINILNLMSTPYSDPRWLTYKQASDMGCQVKRGEKSTPVQYWVFTEKRDKLDENGHPIKVDGKIVKETVRLSRPKLIYHSVFNAQQIEGMPARPDPIRVTEEDLWASNERAEQILKKSGAKIYHDQDDRAYYSLLSDSIHLPSKAQFSTAGDYYSTALHELAHWTGHSNRLDRDMAHPFGSDGYAKEELRAEITSMLLGYELGIGYDPGQHASYVQSWIRVLKDDPKEIFRAAAQAEKAFSHVISLENTLMQDHEPLQPGLSEQATASIRNLMDFAQHQGIDAILDGERVLYTDRKGKSLNIVTSLSENGEVMTYYKSHATGGKTALPDGQIISLERALSLYTSDYVATTESGSLSAEIAARVHGVNVGELPQTALHINAGSVEMVLPQFWDGTVELDAYVRTDNALEEYLQLALDGAPADVYGLFAPCGIGIRSELFSSDNFDDVESLRSLLSDAGQQLKALQLSLSQELESAVKQPNIATERTYLSVPYNERKEFFHAVGKLPNGENGADLDKEARCWFVKPGVDLDKVSRWLPENSPQPDLPKDPRQELADVMADMGFEVTGEHPIMDGEKHRIRVEGDKPSVVDKMGSGFYVAYADGRPAAFLCNNRTQEQLKWKSNGYNALSQEDSAKLRAENAQKVAAREAARLANQNRVALALKRVLSVAPIADATDEYLQKKGCTVSNHALYSVPSPDAFKKSFPDDPDVVIAQDARDAIALRRQGLGDKMILTAGDLLIPGTNLNGEIRTAQIVNTTLKLFPSGTEKSGAFHVVGGTLEDVIKAPIILGCEGYATADAIAAAAGSAVISCYDAGNLENVAKLLGERFPDKAFVWFGDDDTHLELTLGEDKNSGRNHAEAAAEATGGIAVFPVFAPGEKSLPPPFSVEDWKTGNITDEQKTAIENLKRFTDFNDLKLNSILGADGVRRQVSAAMQQALDISHARDQKIQHVIDQHKTQTRMRQL
ncbi:zincin-like metallopeptidase domain-containing protein [Shewanella algae]|uniref:zincin-like metallopeptidase domain-containing protein n=1 Tax=Shewanella algae TaxID=38313 RepID=UPI00300526C0